MALAVGSLLLLTSAAAASAPTATPVQASPTATSVHLQGYVARNGEDTSYQFEYGTTAGYGQQVPTPAGVISDGAPIGGCAGCTPVSADVSGLTQGTTYHWRLVATNPSDTAATPDQTFTTATQSSGQPPFAGSAQTGIATQTNEDGCGGQTAPPAGVDCTGTTHWALSGFYQFTGEGSAPERGVTYHFDYGPTTSYGSSTPPTHSVERPPAGPGTSPLARLSNLAILPSTTYHFRMVATDEPSGTSYFGGDATFVTQPRCLSSKFTFLGASYFGGGKGSVEVMFPAGGRYEGDEVFHGTAFSTGGGVVPEAGRVTIGAGLDPEVAHQMDTSHKPVDVSLPLQFTASPNPPADMSGPFYPQSCVRSTGSVGDGDPFEDILHVTLYPGGATVGALLSALSPSGAAAKIGAILKTGRYPAKTTLPKAGTAQIAWYTLPAGGRAVSAAATKIAAGTKTVTRKGATTIEVKLTTKGRALLKKVKAGNPLKLTGKGSFTPKGGKKVSRTKRFSLKR